MKPKSDNQASANEARAEAEKAKAAKAQNEKAWRRELAAGGSAGPFSAKTRLDAALASALSLDAVNAAAAILEDLAATRETGTDRTGLEAVLAEDAGRYAALVAELRDALIAARGETP